MGFLQNNFLGSVKTIGIAALAGCRFNTGEINTPEGFTPKAADPVTQNTPHLQQPIDAYLSTSNLLSIIPSANAQDISHSRPQETVREIGQDNSSISLLYPFAAAMGLFIPFAAWIIRRNNQFRDQSAVSAKKEFDKPEFEKWKSWNGTLKTPEQAVEALQAYLTANKIIDCTVSCGDGQGSVPETRNGIPVEQYYFSAHDVKKNLLFGLVNYFSTLRQQLYKTQGDDSSRIRIACENLNLLRLMHEHRMNFGCFDNLEARLIDDWMDVNKIANDLFKKMPPNVMVVRIEDVPVVLGSEGSEEVSSKDDIVN